MRRFRSDCLTCSEQATSYLKLMIARYDDMIGSKWSTVPTGSEGEKQSLDAVAFGLHKAIGHHFARSAMIDALRDIAWKPVALTMICLIGTVQRVILPRIRLEPDCFRFRTSWGGQSSNTRISTKLCRDSNQHEEPLRRY